MHSWAAADFEEAWARSVTFLQTAVLLRHLDPQCEVDVVRLLNAGDNIAVSFERADLGRYPCHAQLQSLPVTARRSWSTWPFAEFQAALGARVRFTVDSETDAGCCHHGRHDEDPRRLGSIERGKPGRPGLIGVSSRFVVVYTLGTQRAKSVENCTQTQPAGMHREGDRTWDGAAGPTRRQAHSRVWSSAQSQ